MLESLDFSTPTSNQIINRIVEVQFNLYPGIGRMKFRDQGNQVTHANR